ncbi:tRNA (adenosine(37)-N6)-threonylcarbamoyltransferase complex ATPase subunit type 1 TsaE, partial [Campylobacter coli]|nr:tRNA (adenosine(37)-N6)-threonylcarbamoyltransferase complex ATPase subunit type 1 TsaE [Campylobacter coli]
PSLEIKISVEDDKRKYVIHE